MNIKDYAALMLRLALSFIFIYFGIDKFINPENWIGYARPLENLLPFSIALFILLLGVIETIIGALLLLGLFTQLASIIAFIMLIAIIFTIPFNEISIRDIALAGIAFYLIFNKTKLSLDNLIKKFKKS